MLILFDIDGTILLTQGAGIKAMHDAGRELYGEHFTADGVEFAGRLDTLIWNDLVKINGLKNGDADHDRFRATYGRHLATRLQRDRTAKLLPGVAELVVELQRTPSITIGLLTGNYPETGRLKIKHAGLDPDVFTIAAWGCDGQSRRDLPPVAMQAHRVRNGNAIEANRVVIIGDTPYDIDCAKAHGCRSIGVATGAFTIESLQCAGADLAVRDLSQFDTITRWILQLPI